MCAQFTLKVNSNEIIEDFGITIAESLNFRNENFDIRARGFVKTELAPVVTVDKNNSFLISNMMFSLCPSWSKEFPYKWSSYNARMDRPSLEDPNILQRIYEVPTWRDSFVKGRTCLVPLNGAIESSYFGSHAGKIVQFSKADDSLFYCAGLWDEWLDKSTGELKKSFTLITDDPYEFFFNVGHDRSVFVIELNAQEEWLKNKNFKPKERFDFLRSNRINLDWKVSTERDMVNGWQKRAPSFTEIASTKVWKT